VWRLAVGGLLAAGRQVLIALELCLHVACGAHLVSGFPGSRHQPATAVAPRAAALGACLPRLAHSAFACAVGTGFPVLLSPCGRGLGAGPGVQLSGPPCYLGCFRGTMRPRPGRALGLLGVGWLARSGQLFRAAFLTRCPGVGRRAAHARGGVLASCTVGMGPCGLRRAGAATLSSQGAVPGASRMPLATHRGVRHALSRLLFPVGVGGHGCSICRAPREGPGGCAACVWASLGGQCSGEQEFGVFLPSGFFWPGPMRYAGGIQPLMG